MSAERKQPHRFVVVIPVADRPGHLQGCLESLWALCQRFPYVDGQHISVLLGEDSSRPENIAAQQEMARVFSRRGLAVSHFGQAQQLALLQRLAPECLHALQGVIGIPDAERFFHKGASITRNICALHLAEQLREQPETLIWFIDSDQEFCVNRLDTFGREELVWLDYFHAFDRLFHQQDLEVVTGKVVGDPPVSPAVMAGNFIEDLNAFLAQMAEQEVQAECSFHGQNGQGGEDAAYHDMADLFGYRNGPSPFSFHCPLAGSHDHGDCLQAFAPRLQGFFDGEHPTRRSTYNPSDDDLGLQAARTIYTGNYLLRVPALRFFIPFAPLGLRMAGPVLGRLIRAEIGPRFASVNLPMLHRRTREESNRSEFRPGVEHRSARVDLIGEFERQFYGDVMLFAMERLLEQGYPAQTMSEAAISAQLNATATAMRARYRQGQQTTLQRLQRLQRQFADPAAWWHRQPRMQGSIEAIEHFLANCQANFAEDAPGYRLIEPGEHQTQRLASMARAVATYAADRENWNAFLLASGDPR